MAISTLHDSPASTILFDNHISDDMMERIEAYNRTASASFTEWMTEIFARRTVR